VTLICITISGPETPLPFYAYHCDTGLPMETWGEYLAYPNKCCSTELESGIYEYIEDGEWMIVWKSPYTGSPTFPPTFSPTVGDTIWYDVRGRRVDKRTSGVYISKHGKEVWIK